MNCTAFLPMILTASNTCLPAVPSSASTPEHQCAPTRQVAARADITCELELETFGPRYRIRFGLSNHTAREKIVHYFYPYLDFKVQVTASGRALRVVPSEYEGPVQPTELHLPPHGRSTLDAPVSLVFAPEPEKARWTWTIIGEPPANVVATMDIEGEEIAPCVASIPAPIPAP